MSMALALNNLKHESKEELVGQLVRARNYIKNAKASAEHAGKMVAFAGLATVGGAMSGVLQVKMPKLPGTKIDTDIAVGVVLMGLAAADVFDGADAYLNALGSGLIAGGTARETMLAMQARQQRQAA